MNLTQTIHAEDAIAMMQHWLAQDGPPFCGPQITPPDFSEIADWLVCDSEPFVFDLTHFTSKESLRDGFRCVLFNIRLHMKNHFERSLPPSEYAIAGMQFKAKSEMDLEDNTMSPTCVLLVARMFLKPVTP